MTAPTKPRPSRTAAPPAQPTAAPRKIVSMVRTPVPTARPQVRGKFLFVDDEKFIIKGVTYGPFKPEADGSEYHTIERVRRDFDAMSMAGLNTVRVYTVPPLWLLDVAMEYGLRVMVGLPWEQHITFLDEPGRERAIEQRVREGVRACKRHPAVLCYAIGNEIPSPIVRWHGAPAVERFLGRLYHAAKDEDPDALVVYVNYPTTEYLRAPTDFVCFNVYLETPEKLSNYLARLHSLAGDRPLVMAEVGLDSQRNGEARQAEVMRWQVETALVEGCAGLFAFAWSDEWYRGGAEILDWSFGLVDRDGKPKEALATVARAFSHVPVPPGVILPRISVVVCTYNGSRTIRECLEGVTRLRYTDYEVLVIDDGSKDNAAEIASSFSSVRLIRTPNQGLSAARNLGAAEATGEIVAYIDDDATPDPDWLTYLALTYATNDFAAVGGPNIPPPGDGFIAECVARAPGGPMHVMLTDRVAEHIPGCNMSFIRDRLLDIGGFDTQFRIAGDDVDVCWRLQERGWQLGFSPSAVVWHHRRNSVKTYLKQQRGYGRAEAMLERKWPEKYNAAGHVAWGGKIYAPFLTHFARRVGRIYHGTFGTALFQSVYEPAPSALGIALMVPEWYLLLLLLTFLSALGLAWPVLLYAAPLLALGVGASVLHACLKARDVTIAWNGVSTWRRIQRFSLTATLHLLQPIARLLGRLRGGLSPWRWSHGWTIPVSRVISIWSETWEHQVERTLALEHRLKERRAVTLRGSDFDVWDLEIKGGVLGGARLQMAIEEHGAGRQQIRVRVEPRFGLLPVAFMGALVVMGVKAIAAGELLVTVALVVGALAILLRQLYESGGAVALAAWSIRQQ